MEQVISLLRSLWFHLIALKKEENFLEKEVIRDSVQYIFNELDKRKVLFRIQNEIIALAENGESFEDNINNLLGKYNGCFERIEV